MKEGNGKMNGINMEEINALNEKAKQFQEARQKALWESENSVKAFNEAVQAYQAKWGISIDDTNIQAEHDYLVASATADAERTRAQIQAIEAGNYEREVISIISEENKEKVDENGVLRPEYAEQQEQFYREQFNKNRTTTYANVVTETEEEVQPTVQPQVQQPTVQQPMVGQPPVQQPTVQQPMTEQPVIHQAPLGQPLGQPPVAQPVMHQPSMGQPQVQPAVTQPQINQPLGQPPVTQPNGVAYADVASQLNAQAQTQALEEQHEQQQQPQPAPQPVPVQQPPVQVNQGLTWGTPNAQQQAQADAFKAQTAEGINSQYSSMMQGQKFE